MKKRKINDLLRELAQEINTYDEDKEDVDDILSEIPRKKRKKEDKKNILEQEADRFLQQAPKRKDDKEEKVESNLTEKDGVFKPKFGDYKRIFSKEKPKNEWYHFIDKKNNYLGSVDAASKEEALNHTYKFKDADHIIPHTSIVNKKKEIIPISVQEKVEAPKEALKEEPKEALKEEPKEALKEESKEALKEEPKEPKEEKVDEAAPTTKRFNVTPKESLTDILKRNKPIRNYEDPEHLFESFFESHKRLIHRIATGLKNYKKIPFSMSDEDIEEAGRTALYHTIHKFDENKAKNYFQHSKEAEHIGEYSPDLGFHLFLKSQIENHLIDRAYKKADLPSSVKRHFSAEASKEKAKQTLTTPSDVYIDVEEEQPKQEQPKQEEQKPSRPKIKF